MTDKSQDTLQQLCDRIVAEDVPPILEKYEKYAYLRVRTAPQRSLELFVSPAGRAVFRLDRRRDETVEIVRHAGTERCNGEGSIVHRAEAHMCALVEAELAARAARRVDRKTATALLMQPAFGQRNQPSPQKTLNDQARMVVRRIMAPGPGEDMDAVQAAHHQAVNLLRTEFFTQEASALLNKFDGKGTDYVANHNNALRSVEALDSLLRVGDPEGRIFAEEMMHLPALDMGIRGIDQLRRAVERYTGLKRLQMAVLARDPSGAQGWVPEPESLRPGALPMANAERRTKAVAACQALIDAGSQEGVRATASLPAGIIRMIGDASATLAKTPGEARNQWLAVLQAYLQEVALAIPGEKQPPTVTALNIIGRAIIACQEREMEWQHSSLERMAENARRILDGVPA